MSRAVCRFWQQGNCRYGDSCRFEHPRANNNRFGVFNSGPSGQSAGASSQTAYNLSKETIRKDLTEDLPPWILSSYGPGRDAPDQLWGGYPLEQSFEEIRLHFMTGAASGNPQKAMADIEELYRGAQQRVQTALSNIDGAIQYVVEAENKHPNRIDVCKQGTNLTGEFAVGKRTLGGAFGKPAPASNPFGAPAQSGTSGAFGQASAMGQNPNPFGTPAFGQPSQPAAAFGQPSQPASAFGQAAQATGAFGQPSQMGGGTSAFGQASQMGGGSAFGQASTLGQKPGGFGAPAFGQPSQPSTAAAPAFGQVSQPGALGGSAFGQPSQPGAPAGGAFGQTSQLGASGGSAFGQASQLGGGSAFGQSSALGQKPSPFGANTAAPSPFGSVGANNSNNAATTSPFGQAAQTTPSPFGASAAPAASQTTGAFGKPSALGGSPSPFGQAANNAAASPFGAAATSSPAAANPFGKPQQASPFGAAPASQAMDTSSTPAPSPFGQPAAAAKPAAANPFAQAASGFGQAGAGGGAFATAPAAPAGQAAAAAAAQSGASNNPYPPGASRQHPPLESYSTKDMAGNLATFKGKTVIYKTPKDGSEPFPALQNFDGSFVKIWFPKGPPLHYEATEVEDSKYDDTTKAAYEAFVRTGKFEGGMPEVPPKREWCVWDF